MTKKKLPVRFTGQHFTIDKVLIQNAIKIANISSQDTVLAITDKTEVKVITDELVKRISISLDKLKELCKELKVAHSC